MCRFWRGWIELSVEFELFWREWMKLSHEFLLFWRVCTKRVLVFCCQADQALALALVVLAWLDKLSRKV